MSTILLIFAATNCNDMATLKRSLSKKSDNGKSEIVFRFCGGRNKIFRAKSGIYVDSDKWNEATGRIKSRCLDNDTRIVSKAIEDLSSAILDAFLCDQEGFSKETLDTVIRRFNNPDKFEKRKQGNTLLAVVADFCEQSSNRIVNGKGTKLSAKTLYQYTEAESMLKRFAEVEFKAGSEKQDWPLNEVNESFYNRFVSFMNGEGYALNSIGKYVKNIKVILNSLPSDKTADCGFLKCSKLTEDVDNTYLTIEELKKVEEFDFSKNPKLDRVRDSFLLLAWTGCRFSDMDKLCADNIHDGFFIFRQQKTDNEVYIPLHPSVERILSKYSENLPEPISNQKFNAYIKDVMRIAGINEPITRRRTIEGMRKTEKFEKWQLVSSHTGRRSFASNAYSMGIPAVTIMAITGHKTEAAFLKYIKITKEQHAKKMAEAWRKCF